VSRSLAAHQHN